MAVDKNWYAVYTKSRSEKKVSNLLNKKGIENYCPLNRVYKQWSDRNKIILEPLFRSYVFVKLSAEEHLPVLQTPGILNFVYWLNKPAVIKNEEIETINKFLYKHTNVRLEKIDVLQYDIVTISSGPFMEQIGVVMSVKNKTVKVSLKSLGFLMCAEIELSNVELVSNTSNKKDSVIHNSIL
jgi:transcription antitermination factor NusG